MKPNLLPSQERLNELLSYDQSSGILCWRVTRNTAKAGTIISRKVAAGHIGVNIDGRPYLAHRIIWKMMTGRDPYEGIDHADGVMTNNKWANLREATHSQNMSNTKTPVTNTSGVKGVHFHRRKKKWAASIMSNKRSFHLGYFDRIEDAKLVIDDAREKYHGEFARAA
jgi:hypothetical protein